MPTILLCARSPSRLADVREELEEANYLTLERDLADAGAPSDLGGVDLVIVDGDRESVEAALDFCKSIRGSLGDRFLPVVFITDDPGQSVRAFSSEVGADGHLVRPIEPIELMAQIKALLRIKALQDRIVDQSAELQRVNRRLQLAYEQIDQELVLARRIQQSFLPQSLPRNDRVRFAVKSELSGRVGGDVYDVLELEDDSLAFYVADAMGHGVPASLLTIYVKKGITPTEMIDGSPRLVPPHEVLRRLNADLLAQQLSENPFVTMAYFTLDLKTRTIAFARAGHPYPLLLTAEGGAEQLAADGTLLGIVDTEFEVRRYRMEPGDRLVVFTDGIDAVRYKGEQQGLPSFLACVEDFRGLALDDFIATTYQKLFPTGKHDDDFTLLAVELAPGRRAGDNGEASPR